MIDGLPAASADWIFEGLGDRLAICGDGAAEVLSDLKTLLPGWRPAAARCNPDREADVSIDTEPHGYRVTEWPSGETSLEPDSFSAAYALATRLFERVTARSDQGFILHAGAVMVQRRAVAFAGPAMTGKSTLGAAFTLNGDRLLGDDRIIARISDTGAEAVPLGLAQKLRLPIPEPLQAHFQPLLDRRPGRRIADSLFLDWDADHQLAFGNPAPLAALVLLTRDESMPATIAPMPQARAVRDLLTLSATRSGALHHLDIALALVERLPVLELRYGSCFDARDLILETMRDLGAT